jgi:hypothetical protein
MASVWLRPANNSYSADTWRIVMPSPAKSSAPAAKKSLAKEVAKAPENAKAPEALKPTKAIGTKPTAISPAERMKMIAEAAYYLAEKRGFSGGNELADWATAEKQVDALLAGRR